MQAEPTTAATKEPTMNRFAVRLAPPLLAAALLTACEPPPPQTCEGRTATIVGTAGDDLINGTSGADVILGLGGNDTINALGGDDVVCGVAGNDVLAGGAGNDLLSGGDGFDTGTWAGLTTGAVNANLATGTATGEGTDTLLALEGLTGTGAGDTLTGNASDNTLSGGGGNDTIAAAGGTDTCAVGTGTDAASDCEIMSGTTDTTSNLDTFTNDLPAGVRFFLDSSVDCPGPDIIWSMAAPIGTGFSPTRICNDWERTPTTSGTGTLTVGGQLGTGTGSYAFRLHRPVDATGTITANGAPVAANTTTPGQNVRLSFSGTAGQRISVREPSASFPDGYFVHVIRPNGTVLAYSSHVGSGFTDAVNLDVTGTWTIEINPNADSVGTSSVSLYTVVDQTGSITVGGSSVQANITTPGQNARFSFSGTAGQKVTVRMTNGTFPRGALMYLYKPNGTYLTYGSGFESATITSATLDVSGTWSVGLDITGDGTGTANVAVSPG
jgi:hypothetical protein